MIFCCVNRGLGRFEEGLRDLGNLRGFGELRSLVDLGSSGGEVSGGFGAGFSLGLAGFLLSSGKVYRKKIRI